MISENLLFLRKEHGFSQEDVGEKIGVARQTIAKWENGESIPDVVCCNKLAQLYDVSLDDLVNYCPEEMNGAYIAPKGKYMFGTVTVGEKGQIVIPAKARKIFQINPGDDLIVLGDIEQGLAMVKADLFLETLEQLKEKKGE